MMDMITKEEMAVAYTVSRGKTDILPENVNRVLGDARNLSKPAKGASDKTFKRMMLQADAKMKSDMVTLSKESAVAPEKNIFTLTGFEKPKGKRK